MLGALLAPLFGQSLEYDFSRKFGKKVPKKMHYPLGFIADSSVRCILSFREANPAWGSGERRENYDG